MSRPSPDSSLSSQFNQDFQDSNFSTVNLPSTISNRPRLKDYLATMKPGTWGSNTARSSKRSAARLEGNMRIPPPVSNTNGSSNFYMSTGSLSDSVYSSALNTAETTHTSLPSFNPRRSLVQPSINFEQSPMLHIPSSTHPSSFVPQHLVSYQQPQQLHSYPTDQNSNLFPQGFSSQSQITGNPSDTLSLIQHQQFYALQSIQQPNLPTQQSTVQPPPPTQHQTHQLLSPLQQPNHQSNSTQQLVYQPLPPQQSLQPLSQQSVYGPTPCQHSFYQPLQQPIYQVSSFQQPIHQTCSAQQTTTASLFHQPVSQPQANYYQISQSSQAIPTQQVPHPSNLQQPNIYPSQNSGDLNRPIYQTSLPPKFDPYRPQPVGAYDIPKPQYPLFTRAPTLSQHREAVSPPTRLNPQDIYRPGGLLSTNPSQVPSSSINNNNYNLYQVVQHAPATPLALISASDPPTSPLPPPPISAPIPPLISASDPPPTSSLPPPITTPIPPLISAPNSPPPPPPPPPPFPSPPAPISAPTLSPLPPASSSSPAPAQPPLLLPSSSTANVTANPVSLQSSVPKIADDLLSLALEQQMEATIVTNNTDLNSLELQSANSTDEDSQLKNNSKPIACIQPLSMGTEDQQPVQHIVAPATTLNPRQDPYDDKDKLDQLVADVQRFEKHVSTMTKKILNGTVPLDVEWKVSIEKHDITQKYIYE